MQAAGIALVNQANPILLVLIEAGATTEAFAAAGADAVRAGKPTMAYTLGILRGQMKDAASAKATGLAPPIHRSRVMDGVRALEELIDHEEPDHSRPAKALPPPAHGGAQ